MRSRTGLTALATAASAVVLTTAGATAPATAAETCFGLAPTIVGATGAEMLRGTEGDDVILARGVAAVAALGGDDALCLEGAAYVYAGDGNDRVRSVTDAQKHQVVLGSGSDLFEGSDGRDRVYGENVGGEGRYPGTGTANTDVVHTFGGDDRVWSGTVEQPNADQVDLGEGDDHVTLSSAPGGDARLVGGPGDDKLWAELERTDPASYSFDLEAGTVAADGVRFAVADDFNDLWVRAHGSAVSVRGTDGPNQVDVLGGAAVDTGAGRDVIRVEDRGLRSVAGGAGRDAVRVYVGSPGRAFAVDLRRRRFTRGPESGPFETELLKLRGSSALRHPVEVLGSRRRDVVLVETCGAVVRGAGGSDRLAATSEQCDETVTTLLGGSGDDRLLGGEDRDVLVGGPGHDVADGGDRRDRCRAEVERRCEA